MAAAADATAVTTGFAASFVLRYAEPEGTKAALPYAMGITAFVALVWIAALAAHGAYRWSSVANGITDTATVIRASITAFAVTATTSYITRAEFSRVFILVAFPIGTLLLVIGRRAIRRRTLRAFEQKQIERCALVVLEPGGEDEVARRLPEISDVPINEITEFELPADLVGMERVNAVMRQVEDHGCAAVVLEHGIRFDHILISELSWRLDQRNIELLIVPDLLGEWTAQLVGKRHRSLPVVQLSEPRLNDAQRIQKRTLDIIASAVPLILLSPLFLVIAVVVKLTSPGPAIYSQTRIGFNGKPFRFHKFRTMYVGSDEHRLEVLGRPDEDMAERYKNDPRITPVGHFLRRFSLDEIPQLWDVLRGRMSVVGPRPMLVEELEQMSRQHERRHLAKPGITGLWQISGRKETTWEERMQLDLYYINNWTLALDYTILVKTALVVAKGYGSY